ncbi:hypothetical protein IVB69_04875 [Flavobacterium sp. J49]|uniref:hypothetical protein n=1 Tax=Flavobacterium sp. J49 TaxID=2718534 RepID=UPI001592FA38|nr:hypothetical protein [Flavobacterium sp. J49]MBF6640802.1 hypothetical protein [Flavobacterium sp. J49]NIC02049.1 hypothetical protein [Flavobacterium sp. J49]
MEKKRAYLRNELNLTQEEMAMLLKTKRLQLALYELESRELPSIASKRLTAIEFFMATAKAPEAKDFPKLEEEKEVFLQKALKDCEYYQLGIIRKLPKMEEACQSALKLLQLIDYLKKQVNEEALHPGAISILKEKVQKSLDKNGPKELMKLKLQLQVLQAEEALLKNLIEGSGLEKQL